MSLIPQFLVEVGAWFVDVARATLRNALQTLADVTGDIKGIGLGLFGSAKQREDDLPLDSSKVAQSGSPQGGELPKEAKTEPPAKHVIE